MRQKNVKIVDSLSEITRLQKKMSIALADKNWKKLKILSAQCSNHSRNICARSIDQITKHLPVLNAACVAAANKKKKGKK